MAEKSVYRYRVEPEAVDFTMHATISALGAAVLNAAGVDAHGKGFGVDALTKHNCSWVSTRNFVLEDAEGRTFGRAVSQWAMIDLDTRTALDLSGVGRAHDDALVAEPSPAEKPRKIRSVEPAEHLAHRVAYSDIDFNRHMNTMRYIDLMFDCMPVETASAQRPVRCDIHFLRECRHGDLLDVGWERRDDALWLFAISCEGHEAVRASVEWRGAAE